MEHYLKHSLEMTLEVKISELFTYPRPAGLFLVAAQEFAQAVGGGNNGGAVGATGLASQAFDGSRDRYGSDHTAGRAADRGGHGGDAGFAFPN